MSEKHVTDNRDMRSFGMPSTRIQILGYRSAMAFDDGQG